MKRPFILTVAAMLLASAAMGQTSISSKRTITKTDSFDFKSGGTVAVTGAPNGSIEIVGSSENKVEITAEILLQAASEADLDSLANLTGFITDESAARTGILSIGIHNKFGQKKLPKNFPKSLVGLPFTINYVVHVPRFTDVEVDGGRGDLKISGVEGAIRVNYLESNATIEVIGGNTAITITKGTADVTFGTRGWRGRPASIQLASGDLTVRLPTTASAELDAVVLRTGMIENEFPDLKPRDRKAVFTERSMYARVGVGGASLKFTVGDGNLRIEPLGSRP